MNILHYTLGFPPNRSGGLVNYSLDLITQESKTENVSVLFPGRSSIFKIDKPRIVLESIKEEYKVYELCNSLPLALFGGIKEPNDFYSSCDQNIYLDFFEKNSFNVIHVHTIMGLHIEFFRAAKVLGIPIIYTAHDYYGLSPLPNFFLEKTYDYSYDIEDWVKMSVNAMSTKQLKLFQNKNYYLIRKMKKFLKIFFKNNNTHHNQIDKNKQHVNIEEFINLKKYYRNIFSLIDFYHFNSSITKKVFCYQLQELKISNKIISITNSNIKNREKNNRQFSEKLNIAYIGPNSKAKGFNRFIKLSTMMDSEKFNFLSYGHEINRNIKTVKQHGKYSRNNLKKIYSEIDILIVPSEWKETFGLIVIEALSYGKIVFVSQNVGAKDLLCEYNEFANINELKIKLENLDLNKAKSTKLLKTMEEHTKELIQLYSRRINNV